MMAPYVKNVQTMLYNKGIEYHPIAELSIRAMVGPSSPLYGTQTSITLDELAQHTLLQIADSSEDPQQSIVHALGLANRCFGRLRVNNWQTFFRVVQEAPVVGLEAVSPEKFAHNNDVKNLHFMEIEDCDICCPHAEGEYHGDGINGDVEFIGCGNRFTHPPMSWCYVEEEKLGKNKLLFL